jgi:hypothetical protein
VSLDLQDPAAFEAAAATRGSTLEETRRVADRGARSTPADAEPVAAPRGSLGSLAGPPAPGRPRMRAVTVSVDAGRYRVQVEIERDHDRALGLTEGPLLASAARRLVAEAALQALALLGIGADRAAVDAVVIESLGDQTVALVTVMMDGGTYEEAHVGAAVVRATGEHDAIARAVLDATNRRLSTRG